VRGGMVGVAVVGGRREMARSRREIKYLPRAQGPRSAGQGEAGVGSTAGEVMGGGAGRKGCTCVAAHGKWRKKWRK
jgi:hypothetical protein